MRLDVTEVFPNSEFPCAWEVYEGTDLIARIRDNGAANAVEIDMYEPFKLQFLGDLSEDQLAVNISKPFAATILKIDMSRNMLVIKSLWSDLDIN